MAKVLHIILPETEELLDGSADPNKGVACRLSRWRIDLWMWSVVLWRLNSVRDGDGSPDDVAASVRVEHCHVEARLRSWRWRQVQWCCGGCNRNQSADPTVDKELEDHQLKDMRLRHSVWLSNHGLFGVDLYLAVSALAHGPHYRTLWQNHFLLKHSFSPQFAITHTFSGLCSVVHTTVKCFVL